MKFSAIVALVALALSSVAAVEIPAEHHERFLAEQATLINELSEWKASAAGQYAKAKGFYTEPQSTDATESVTVDTANLKRLYLTKLAITEAQALNPEAVLSINTPFTLMTDDEFAAYVRRGYGSGGFDALWAAQNITLATEEETTTTAGRQLATSVDWTTSGCVAAVKDQGNCGSCWAFSSIGTLESAYCLKNGALSLFSEQQVTSCDTSNSGCDGGIMTTALAYINKAGFICSEDSYPFTSAETGLTGTCSTSGCDKTTISIKKVVSVTASESALVSAITTTPVAVAVAAGNTAWKQYTSGVLSACTSSTLDHAVLAVGYDSTSFKIRNQWGTSWGDEGYIYLKRNGSKSACGVVNTYNCYPTLN